MNIECIHWKHQYILVELQDFLAKHKEYQYIQYYNLQIFKLVTIAIAQPRWFACLLAPPSILSLLELETHVLITNQLCPNIIQ